MGQQACECGGETFLLIGMYFHSKIVVCCLTELDTAGREMNKEKIASLGYYNYIPKIQLMSPLYGCRITIGGLLEVAFP